jgi:hypothetical protein
MEVNGIGFVVNSLTKPDCSVLTVLIPLQVLLNFRIAYSPLPSMRHQGTFNWYHSLISLLGLTAWIKDDVASLHNHSFGGDTTFR